MRFFTKEHCIYCRSVNAIDLGELRDFTVDNIWGYCCWKCDEKVPMSEYDGYIVQFGAKVFEV